jgi:hypothetical protein
MWLIVVNRLSSADGEPAAGGGQGRGIKLMEIKRLRAKGQRIILLDQRRFWKLAAAKR